MLSACNNFCFTLLAKDPANPPFLGRVPGPGTAVMVAVRGLRRSQGGRKEKQLGRDKEWESCLAWAVCRRGDSWWRRRIRELMGVGGTDVVLSHRPPVWPRRWDLHTGLSWPKPRRRQGEEKRGKQCCVLNRPSLPSRLGLRRVPSLCSTYTPPFRPVNRGILSQT